MIKPDLFPNWMTYTERYCDRKHTGFGWDISGSSNTAELNQILEDSIMIRRTKAKVLPDLPAKTRSFYPLEMDPVGESVYWEAENNFIRWMVEVLKQEAVKAKMDHALEWISDFLDSGEKLVVFAVHKFVIDILMQKFGNVAVKLDGRTQPLARQVAVDQFQTHSQTKLFIGNIRAAGVGITLTAASNVVFLELPWTPGELVQAEDRCHRYGQKDAVNIYYLLAENTIEERIAQLLDDKRQVLDALLDGKKTEQKDLLMELLDEYEQ